MKRWSRRRPLREALEAWTGPMPWSVERLGASHDEIRSSSLWCGHTRCTLPTKRRSLYSTPLSISCETWLGSGSGLGLGLGALGWG